MIEKLAEMVGVTPQAFMIGVGVLVVLFIIIYIKITLDEKKGVNSQEKQDIRKIISNLVPDGEQYTAAYAHSKEVYGTARMRREVYHYYAVGFKPEQPDHLWVVPIGVERGKIVLYLISVDGSNTKLGKECQVNIQQKEEAEAFRKFAEAFQECVNRECGVDKKGRALKKS